MRTCVVVNDILWYQHVLSPRCDFILPRYVHLTEAYLFFDMKCFVIGYHGDLNETYPVGEVDEDSKKLINTARTCLSEAIKICKPGALLRDIGKVMYVKPISIRLQYLTTEKWLREPIARANGCATVRTYTGHGINDLFHCSPNIPHYAKNKAVGTMKAGMVSFLVNLMLHSMLMLAIRCLLLNRYADKK